MNLFSPPIWLGFSAVTLAALVFLLILGKLLIQQFQLRAAEKKSIGPLAGLSRCLCR